MSYRTIQDLPEAQVDQYSDHQKEAFLKAFNNAWKQYRGDESRAFAVAHAAAKRGRRNIARRTRGEPLAAPAGAAAATQSPVQVNPR